MKTNLCTCQLSVFTSLIASAPMTPVDILTHAKYLDVVPLALLTPVIWFKTYRVRRLQLLRLSAPVRTLAVPASHRTRGARAAFHSVDDLSQCIHSFTV